MNLLKYCITELYVRSKKLKVVESENRMAIIRAEGVEWGNGEMLGANFQV
jgi:hypothetical protein